MNLPTLIVIIIIAALTASVIVFMRRNKSANHCNSSGPSCPSCNNKQCPLKGKTQK